MDAKRVSEVMREAESRAHPAVFRGLNKTWPAVNKWAGQEGFAYLSQAAGHATVQAMYASSGDFFGDIEQHTSVACTLGELLAIAAQHQQQQHHQQQQQHHQQQQQHHHQQQQRQEEEGEGVQPQESSAAAAAVATAGGGDLTNINLYLAQQSLEDPDLSVLLQDLPTPEMLQGKQLTSINMWFSSRPSRSSTHYDPYQNLLCVVTGRKRVKLFRPDAIFGLYPRALGGEASNHSCVNFAEPDFDKHPLYRHVLSQAVDVELYPGDALFIPEGWWHQVDSDGMTFAVNFWWSSELTEQLKALPHQHHFYLRQLLSSTSSEVVQLLLAGIKPWKPPLASATAAAGTTAAAAEAATASHWAREDSTEGSRKRRRVEAAEAAAGDPGSIVDAAANILHGQQWNRKSDAAAAAGAAAAAATPDDKHIHGGTSSDDTSSSSSGSESSSNSSSSSSSSDGSSSGDDSSSSAVAGEHRQCNVQLSDLEQAALAELQDAVAMEVGCPAPAAALDASAMAGCSQAAVCQSPGQADQQDQQQKLSPSAQQQVSIAGGTSTVLPAENQATAAKEHHHIHSKLGPAAAADMGIARLVSDAWLQQQQVAQQQLLAEAVSQLSPKNVSNKFASSIAVQPTDPGCTEGGELSNNSKLAAAAGTLQDISKQHHGPAVHDMRDLLGLDSRISKLLVGLKPAELLRVLWVASGTADKGGRREAVRELLLRGLTPVVAQILPQMFELADELFESDVASGCSQKMEAEGACVQQEGFEQLLKDREGQRRGARLPFTREQFYARLYGTVEEPSAVLRRLVMGKAQLALTAADLIVKSHLGVLA